MRCVAVGVVGVPFKPHLYRVRFALMRTALTGIMMTGMFMGHRMIGFSQRLDHGRRFQRHGRLMRRVHRQRHGQQTTGKQPQPGSQTPTRPGAAQPCLPVSEPKRHHPGFPFAPERAVF